MKNKIEYRVVKKMQEGIDGKDKSWYSIQEVYFDDNNEVYAQTTDLQVEGGQLEELISQLDDMKESIKKPIVGEINFGNINEIDAATNTKGGVYGQEELNELQQEFDFGDIKERK